MRLKICKRCGKQFAPATKHIYLCSDCVEQSRRDHMRQRVCQTCGVTFAGGPTAKYCPSCRADRQKQRKKRYNSVGSARHIGDTDLCERCGNEYIITGGMQKYCPDCSKIVADEADRAKGLKYYYDNREAINERRNALRHKSTVCVVCGKVFESSSPRVTCSEECAKERRRQWQRKADVKREKR